MEATGESRLQKLLNLLENGTNEVTRKAAAKHISDIAKAHPAQLPSILRKVHPYLHSKKWECRVAAGEAVGLIAEHFVHHSVLDLCGVLDQRPEDLLGDSPCEPLMQFKLQQVLGSRNTLLASGGQEYEHEETMGVQEHMAYQRNRLLQKLGDEVSRLVQDADLMHPPAAVRNPDQDNHSEGAGQATGLSAREKNRLKRKARTLARTDSAKSQQFGLNCQGNDAVEDRRALPVQNAEDAAEEDQNEWQRIVGGSWAFQKFCDECQVEVLDSCWEVRHGAALALREVLRSQAGSAKVSVKLVEEPTGWALPGKAGKRMLRETSIEDIRVASHANRLWIEECVVVLLCVLCLDRMGDFVSDQMVAPVRETAAQALGAALQNLPIQSVKRVLTLLQEMVCCESWEVRHGGLLALKYLLAARSDVPSETLPLALPAILRGLEDGYDDVRAAAAEVLVPVAMDLAQEAPQVVGHIRKMLWDILLDMDDLSSATASVMQLLWQLYSQPGTFETGSQLVSLTPRLWPFFRHSLSTVRLASVQCLEQLIRSTPVKGTRWLHTLLQDALVYTFCNLLLETKEEVLERSELVWHLLLDRCEERAIGAAIQPISSILFQLAATPLGRTLDEGLISQLHSFACNGGDKANGGLDPGGDGRPRKRARLEGDSAEETQHVVGSQWAGNATRMRIAVAKALGHMAAKLERSTTQISSEILQHVSSASATSRVLACLVIWFWLEHKADKGQVDQGGNSTVAWPVPAELVGKCYEILSGLPAAQPVPGSPEPYVEVVGYYHKLRGEWGALLGQCAQVGMQVQDYLGMASDRLSVEAICELTQQLSLDESLPAVRGLQQQILTTATTLKSLEDALHTASTACASASAVRCGSLPPKLNSIIQPLMGATRKESEPLLQQLLAQALAELIILCRKRKPSPTKMLKNICSMACGDPLEVPCVQLECQIPEDGGEPGLLSFLAVGQGVDFRNPAVVSGQVARRGAEAVLTSLATSLQTELFEDLPQLWDHMTSALATQEAVPDGAQLIVNCLQILKVVGAVVVDGLLEKIVGVLPAVCNSCKHARPSVRLAAARCIAALANAHTERLMPPVLEMVIPMLENVTCDTSRQGAVVVLFHLVEQLGPKLAAYTVLLIVPLMVRMCDPVESIRLISTSCFGTLVGLLPLAQGMPPPDGLTAVQLEACNRDCTFLSQLLDNTKVEDYKVPVSVNATLRQYQQEGINWLAFLRRFGLHGVLADDMGLGKTLQAVVSIASSTFEAEQKHALTGKVEDAPLPSIVVCPATLVAHWSQEIGRFLEEDTLQPLQYLGTPAERAALQSQMAKHNVVVMSYEALRADVEWAVGLRWNYCVLDEGHVIKNPATRIAQACKQIVAKNRLILSGTPIQNNVLELWSLFDFLMPGFLGTRKDFMHKYGKAVQAARYSKKGSAEAEAGLLALGSLHKQIMPFVMRRTKDEVLSDLPPKIIQDIYCELSPLQCRLYEDFSRSQASADLTAAVAKSEVSNAAPHVFQSLQYLRRLCGHPLLALDWSLPEHRMAINEIVQPHVSDWESAREGLKNTVHAPKLQALKELLAQCGIQSSNGSSEVDSVAECTPIHRMLVFAQLKGLLDIVETDVLRAGGIAYLRLDGSVETRKRMDIVHKFNSDPTIGVLLLTTRVGGLGLNLTSADTVVFLEHDWNPMNDLQAMDRVHRLGQERTVNVYRVLTKGTLEEKILGLQRFKMTVANSVVNKDNMSMQTMDTSKLLDVFSYTPAANVGQKQKEGEGSKSGSGVSGLKSVWQGIEELWDEKQYEEEFSMDNFMKKLAKGGK